MITPDVAARLAVLENILRGQSFAPLATSGVYTPVIAGATTPGTNTYNVQDGRWVLNGKLCHYKFQLSMTAKDGAMAGAIYVTLPFTSATDVVESGCEFTQIKQLDLSAGYSQFIGTAGINSNRLNIQQVGDNVDTIAISASALVATSRIYGSGWFLLP